MISEITLVEHLKLLRRPQFIIYDPIYNNVPEVRVRFFSLEGRNLRDMTSEMTKPSFKITNEIAGLAQEVLTGFKEVSIGGQIWLTHSNVIANISEIGIIIPYPDPVFPYGTFINDYLIELRTFCRCILGIPIVRLEYSCVLYNAKIKKSEKKYIDRCVEQFVDVQSIELFMLLLLGKFSGPNQINWIGELQELYYLIIRMNHEKIIDFKYQKQYKFVIDYFFLNGKKIDIGLLKNSRTKKIKPGNRQKLNAVINNILHLMHSHVSSIS